MTIARGRCADRSAVQKEWGEDEEEFGIPYRTVKYSTVRYGTILTFSTVTREMILSLSVKMAMMVPEV